MAPANGLASKIDMCLRLSHLGFVTILARQSEQSANQAADA
jgi:hypothetical protein